MLKLKREEEVVKEFSKGQFDADENFREEIYGQYSKSDTKLFCDCQTDMIPMSVVKNTHETVFLRNFSNSGHRHKKECHLHKDYQSDSPHEEGWEPFEGEDGFIHYRISKQSTYKSDKKKKGEGDVPKRALFIRDKDKVTKTKVTTLGIGTKISLMSQYALANKRVSPDVLSVARKQTYHTLGLIHFSKRKKQMTYRDILYQNIHELRDAPSRSERIVYMPLISVERNERYLDGYAIPMVNIVMDKRYFDEETESLEILCETSLYKHAVAPYKSTNLNQTNKDGKPNKYTCMVLGFIRVNQRGWKKGLEFTDVVFIPIDKRGVWVESFYERHVFNALHDQNVVFHKPFEGIEEYRNWIPDLIIRNPKHPERFIIGEIFGRTDEDYVKRKKEKIALLNSLEHVDTWYWDVTENPTDIPPIVGKDFTCTLPNFKPPKKVKKFRRF